MFDDPKNRARAARAADYEALRPFEYKLEQRRTVAQFLQLLYAGERWRRKAEGIKIHVEVQARRNLRPEK